MRRVLLIASAVIMAVVAVSGVLVTVATVTAPFCSGCHFRSSDFREATLATGHSQVECVSCHVDTDRPLARTESGFYQVFGMWIPVLDPSRSDATVARDAQCLSCHQPVMESVVDARGVRIAHESCAVANACTDCHSEVGHGQATSWPRVASMNDCTRCHRDMRVSLACETCHTGEKVEIASSAAPEFSVTHGPTWRQTHGMGAMDSCSVCHEDDACSNCHGPGVPHAANFLLQHAATSQETGAACVSCHDSAFCDACHLTPMPHPRSFVQTHSQVVEEGGDTPCLRCHDSKDCETCHITHVHPGGSVGPIPSPARDAD